MADLRLGGRREDRRVDRVRLAQPPRKRDAAHRAGGLVVLEARAHEVAPHDALHGKHVRLHHDHRAPLELLAEGAQLDRVLVHVGGQDVVRHDVREEAEPEERHLGEQDPLARDAGGQDDVEGAQAVRGHHEQPVAEVVDVAHLPLSPRLHAGKARLEQRSCLRIDVHRSVVPLRREVGSFRPATRTRVRRRAGSLPEARSGRQQRKDEAAGLDLEAGRDDDARPSVRPGVVPRVPAELRARAALPVRAWRPSPAPQAPGPASWGQPPPAVSTRRTPASPPDGRRWSRRASTRGPRRRRRAAAPRRRRLRPGP